MQTNQGELPREGTRKQQHFSPLKATIETAFYGNNVKAIESLDAAYNLAYHAPQTTVLAKEVKHAEELGLPNGAKVLLTNDGAIVGRTAKARRIVGDNALEDQRLFAIVREAMYAASFRPFVKANSVVGLDEAFMLKAHIMLPEQDSISLYSWLLNFQMFNTAYGERYQAAQPYPENEIYIFCDSSWSHPDYPEGLAYFDPQHNVACILGLRYFGEIKKATLTLAWATAHRNGFIACHGGLKKFTTTANQSYVAAFFGLSGSGKSTLTHAKHKGKYGIEVLHDDAFIINGSDGSSIALEPSYFDKTSDYSEGHPEQDYFMTIQNCGVTLNNRGEKIVVTEDIRNGNGRTVKSRFATANRVDRIDQPLNAVYWIMKDDSLPPLLKLDDPLLATLFGCTLATKRSTAENTTEDMHKLVIEPYANPFRVYPLVEDFNKFKTLFESGISAYIINTGYFMGKKITPEDTLMAIESVVDGTGDYAPFSLIAGCSYLQLERFPVPLTDADYQAKLSQRLKDRLDFVEDFNSHHPHQTLPEAAVAKLQQLYDATRFNL